MPPAVAPPSYREKMSTVDTAWLRMDSPSNLMMIVAVLMFERPMDIGRFRQTMTERLLPYQRFRSRVVHEFGASWWQEQEVDLDRHILHSNLKKAQPDNKAALEQLVARLSATPLDPGLPLWQMQVVDNCIGADGRIRQAVIIRIHHCIADGIALVGVLLSMFDSAADAPPRAAPPSSRLAPLAAENPWLQMMQPVTRTTIKAINLSSLVWSKYLWMLVDPQKFMARFTEVGHATTRLTQDATRLALMADDSRTRLKGKPQGTKHVAWSEPLPLAEVKAIGHALGASVNDVLMACVAGAIGAYLRDKGDAVAPDCALRAMIPVNLRKSGGAQKLGNAFGLVPLVLPVGLEDPLGRLREVRRRMDELKDGYQALVAMALLGVLGATPKQMQNEIQNYFARKATAVMSNVPGPQAPLYLAGSRLDQIMFWVPQSGDIGVGVSILSYNGGVQFGIVTDDQIAPDPHQIIRRFAPEFEKLVMLALMAA
ncbi:MAG TPA: wax ester/triacylglycerol synthase family O-acyltransferase [Burkholderiaceae bacterium]|nr:wax ester/triacylglycerol synthase family O-acyltransferase [Burkholderiaceae bacterium]